LKVANEIWRFWQNPAETTYALVREKVDEYIKAGNMTSKQKAGLDDDEKEKRVQKII